MDCDDYASLSKLAFPCVGKLDIRGRGVELIVCSNIRDWDIVD